MANEKPAHVERMLDEYRELEKRIDKLNDFIGTEKWFSLQEVDCILLSAQKKFMEGYAEILSLRLDRA